MFATEVRRKREWELRAFLKWSWHVDEVFVKVNCKRHYFWRVIDHEGEVLEATVTKRINKAAALKFLKKSIKRYGRTEEVVTDRLSGTHPSHDGRQPPTPEAEPGSGRFRNANQSGS